MVRRTAPVNKSHSLSPNKIGLESSNMQPCPVRLKHGPVYEPIDRRSGIKRSFITRTILHPGKATAQYHSVPCCFSIFHKTAMPLYQEPREIRMDLGNLAQSPGGFDVWLLLGLNLDFPHNGCMVQLGDARSQRKNPESSLLGRGSNEGIQPSACRLARSADNPVKAAILWL